MVAPEGLGERGMAMWVALTAAREFDAAWGVLIAEACRISDRLEKLDRLLRRDIDAWACIEVPDAEGHPLVLVFDDALAEARQQTNALRQIVVSLKLGVASETKSERSAFDDLADRRRARIAGESAATN